MTDQTSETSSRSTASGGRVRGPRGQSAIGAACDLPGPGRLILRALLAAAPKLPSSPSISPRSALLRRELVPVFMDRREELGHGVGGDWRITEGEASLFFFFRTRDETFF